MYIVLLFLLLIVDVTGALCQSLTTAHELSTREVYELHTKANVVLLDVRSHEEYTKGHMPNAQWLNIEDINLTNTLEAFSKDITYILYDNGGKRSLFATRVMSSIGFTHVYRAKEGVLGWKKAGYWLSRGTCGK